MRNFTRNGELKTTGGASSGASASSSVGTLLAAGLIAPLEPDDDAVAIDQEFAVAEDLDGIAEAQAVVEDTGLSLEAPAAELIPPRYLAFGSIADLSGVSFEIVGTDQEGTAVSELLEGPLGAAQDDDGIAEAQAMTEDEPLVLEEVAASLNPPRALTFTSASDLSGLTFEIVGTDENGEPQTVAAFQGPNATTVSTTEKWSSVESITPSATNANNVEVGWADTVGFVISGNAYTSVDSITPDANGSGDVEVGWFESDTTFSLVLEQTEFDTPRRISVSSGDDLSSVTFLVVGTHGTTVIEEAVQGPNADTVTTEKQFSAVEAIIPQTLVQAVSVSAGWPSEPAAIFKSEKVASLTHIFLRNDDETTLDIDLSIFDGAQQIPWRKLSLAEGESASVLNGEPALPLPANYELRANLAEADAVAFMIFGTEIESE